MRIRLIYFDSLNRNQKNQPNPYLLFVIYKKSVIFADSSTKKPSWQTQQHHTHKAISVYTYINKPIKKTYIYLYSYKYIYYITIWTKPF